MIWPPKQIASWLCWHTSWISDVVGVVGVVKMRVMFIPDWLSVSGVGFWRLMSRIPTRAELVVLPSVYRVEIRARVHRVLSLGEGLLHDGGVRLLGSLW